MEDKQYQEILERRKQRKRIQARRKRRRRRILALLSLAVVCMSGMAIGMHRYHVENPPVEYTSFDGDSPMIDVAKQELGNEEGDKFWSWYGFTSRVEWCACFVSWVENENGYIDEGKAPMFCSVPLGISWFEEHGQWVAGSETPKAGYVVFFDWDADGYGDHVGLVSDSFNGYVYTIEGNSHDKVRRKRYKVGSKCLLGYGRIEE